MAPSTIPGIAHRWKTAALVGMVLAGGAPVAHAQTIATREARFYSEAVVCYAKLYLLAGFSDTGKWPAVVMAPGWGDTAASIDQYAARLASKGLVAMAIDYRGWGRSGGFLYLAEPVRVEDRLRFSQHTARTLIRRKRLIPDHQVLDIRNAISFLQGEPGVDRARIGVWGTDMAGGHVVTVAAIDARIKAGVAQVPIIAGRDAPRKSFAPTPDQQAAAIRLARTTPAATAGGSTNDVETKLALAEYHPFHLVDQIPAGVALLFVVADKDAAVDNDANAVAASKLLKGATGVTRVSGATHALATPTAFEAAADAAAEWFLKHL